MNAPTSTYKVCRVFAIVPAAGRSRRMGLDKQSMPVGGRTMLAAAIEPILASKAEGVLAVVRKEIAASLIEDFQAHDLAAAARLAVVFNENPEAEMIDSVRIGIAEWERRAQPGPSDGYLIVPGDLPGLPVEIVARCIDLFAADPSRIVVAAHNGKTGHPLIFPQALAAFVQSPGCDAGLNLLKKQFESLLTLVEAGDSKILRNVNTPEDYQSLRE